MINGRKRPAIIVDMESVLLCKIRNSLETGNEVTKPAVKTMATEIFSKLRALGIYDPPGERNVRYADLSVEQINTLLDGTIDFTECPLCYGFIRDKYYAMHDHIRQAHSLTHGVPQETP